MFPNTPPGLDRALGWITRSIAEQSALVVIEGVGSYGAGLAQRVTDAGVLVAEPSEMPASARRGSARLIVGHGPYRALGPGGRHLAAAVAPSRRPAGGAAGAGCGSRADGH